MSGGAPDPREAERYHERFVSTRDEDRDFDNQTYQKGAAQYLETLPDDEFDQAARSAIAQSGPREREDLLGGLLNALGGMAGGGSGGRGGMGDALGGLAGAGGLGAIAKMLGLGSTDPRKMSDDDATRLMNYARKENPEALRQTVQEKPWFLKALGNPVVLGALSMVATQLLRNRRP